MCITKLDVMDGIEEIKICTGYEFEGKTIDILPFGADAVAKCKPIYETLPGWKESTFGVKEYGALPENAKRYLKRIEEVCGAPVAIIPQAQTATKPFCCNIRLPKWFERQEAV